MAQTRQNWSRDTPKLSHIYAIIIAYIRAIIADVHTLLTRIRDNLSPKVLRCLNTLGELLNINEDLINEGFTIGKKEQQGVLEFVHFTIILFFKIVCLTCSLCHQSFHSVMVSTPLLVYFW